MRTKLLHSVVALAIAAGCTTTTQKREFDQISGPSTFAKDLNISAAPDIITQNGFDTSIVRIAAKSPNGTPLAGLQLRAEIRVNGVTQDFGTLSSKFRVTESDGTTSFTYTAPPPPVSTVPLGPQTVQIAVLPVGSDFAAEFTRTVDIKLLPLGIIGPNNPTLVALFTVTPNPPTAFSIAQFDASLSTNQGAPCGAACSYTWDFGDNTSGAGIRTTHEYRTSGAKTVKLTVVDTLGATALAQLTFTVAQATPPTAVFTVSPTGNIALEQDAFFNASGSRPATGRSITGYLWDFGDRTTGAGVNVSHRWRVTGTFNVVLTVTDDAGSQTQSTPTAITVVTGNPTASFVVVTTPLGRGVPIVFDASASTAVTGSLIARYTWSWGDGTNAESTTSPIISHTYNATGPMAVVLTVTDIYGRTAQRVQQITIP
jgi:PKD repeat protein